MLLVCCVGLLSGKIKDKRRHYDDCWLDKSHREKTHRFILLRLLNYRTRIQHLINHNKWLRLSVFELHRTLGYMKIVFPVFWFAILEFQHNQHFVDLKNIYFISLLFINIHGKVILYIIFRFRATGSCWWAIPERLMILNSFFHYFPILILCMIFFTPIKHVTNTGNLATLICIFHNILLITNYIILTRCNWNSLNVESKIIIIFYNFISFDQL